MKNLLLLLLSTMFLASCTEKEGDDPITHTPVEPALSTEIDDFFEEVVDAIEEGKDSINAAETENDVAAETFTLKAKFIDFHLGDAEHYGFEDESGEHWDFAGCDAPGFEFAQMLDESESDESNQGWTSNADLQGAWFNLTYYKREQPQYIDGPMVFADIISIAELIEE